jgi:hypothetical protein
LASWASAQTEAIGKIAASALNLISSTRNLSSAQLSAALMIVLCKRSAAAPISGKQPANGTRRQSSDHAIIAGREFVG